MLVQEMTYPGGTRVLVWRLEEEAPRLLALCREAGIPVEDLEELPVKRQREKAAERLLLCHAFGWPVTLLHDGQGAPSLQEMEVNISITHTMKLVALAWNEDLIIGLDAMGMNGENFVPPYAMFLAAAVVALLAAVPIWFVRKKSK